MAVKKRRWKRIGIGLSLAALATFGFCWAANASVLNGAEGRVYTDVDAVPAEGVGLVLGTSPKFHGARNPFFERRMDAATQLYKAGKVHKLLVSGDNGNRFYDEPTAMRKALIDRGVPNDAIVLDYAGFRTLDSVVRAHTVFGLDRFTIVTDDFHLPRALYIARERGINAVGFQTRPLPRGISNSMYVREVGARVLIWLDLHVWNTQPKIAGPKEPILTASL